MTTFADRGALTADQLISLLDLRPHPEGGYFRETLRDADSGDGRGASTAIYFLLPEGEESGWHRVDATEVWHFYAGAPLLLLTQRPGGAVVERVLGTDLTAGHSPQIAVAPHEWQAARTTGSWTLVGCTVAPAFDFEGFELAPEGHRSAFSGERPPESR